MLYNRKDSKGGDLMIKDQKIYEESKKNGSGIGIVFAILAVMAIPLIVLAIIK